MPSFANQFDLSADQSTILADVLSWLKNRPTSNEQSLTIGGYAGTGKTTLVSVLRLAIKEVLPKYRVAFACYTGKASQVLRSKLIANSALFPQDFCGTIHSLMYTAVLDSDGKILTWRRTPKLEYDLIIVDEASMVTSDIWNDLSKYELPMIAVGDHGQLPPIESAFNLMDNPQLRLETIHRQAKGNPIIEIATMARESGVIPTQRFSANVHKVSRNHEDSTELFNQWVTPYSADTLVLCARNKTRIQLNKQIRGLLGYESDTPQVGETLICLKNNYESEGGTIYNGMLGKLKRLEENYLHWYNVEIEFHDEGRVFEGDISRHQFFQEKLVDKVKGLHYTKIGDRFDFGYALTVHKAQGSQAKTVILFEEYAPYMSDEEWRRWLYTAVTRASERLLIIR
jgi:exodeoxyribonuclease V